MVREDLTDAAGTITMYWLTAYDPKGRSSQVTSYDVSGALLSTATYSYSGNLRTAGSVIDLRGMDAPTTISIDYAYSDDVLASSTQRIAGAVTYTNNYVFEAGRKLTTFRYAPDGALQARTEFAYDSGKSRRLGATSYDASNTITGSSLRTYEGDLFTETRIESGTTVQYRKFKFEDGPCAVDPEIYFEF
jgi:hypothetical protein